MGCLKAVIFSLTFLLLLQGVSAEICPKEPIPVTPEQHAILIRAQKEMEKGRDRQALKILSDFSAEHSEKPHPHFLFLKGLIEYRLKNFKNAEMLFEKAIRQDPCFGEAWQNLGIVYQIQKRPVLAAQAMQRAFSLIKPENPDLKYQAALLHVHGGKSGSALPLLEELANHKKPRVEWLLALSHVYTRLSNPAKAALAMERANRLKPDPEYQYQAACLWIEADRFQKALLLLETVCAKNTAPGKWRATLIHVLERLGKTEKAAKLIAEKTPQEKSTAESFRLALLYLKEGHPEKALPVLQELAKNHAPDPQWIAALAITLDTLDKPNKACAVMKRVEIQSPSSLSPKVQLQIAVFWLHHNQPNRALPLLEVLVKKPSASQGTRIAYIEALVQSGKAKRANAVLKQLLNRYPEDQRIWRLQAWSALEQEDFGKAAAALEVAFRLKPPGPREWKRLGNIYRLAGIPRKAAPAYQKAFGRDPSAADFDLLAATYEQAHQMKKALFAAVEAVKTDPTAKRFSRLGQLYMIEEDWAKGLKAFQKAAQMADDGGINSLRAGYAAWKLDRLDLAETSFKSVLEKADPKSQTASRAAHALKSIKQFKKRKSSTS